MGLVTIDLLLDGGGGDLVAGIARLVIFAEEAPQFARIGLGRKDSAITATARQIRRTISPTKSEAITNTTPLAVIQNEKLLRNGKATSRAPIWSGTT